MYAKSRLDALSDGIFAVAMTLLVLDLRLPEDFDPKTSTEFLHGLIALWPKFLPYMLSFGVLGMRWLSNVMVRSHEEMFGRDYVRWWMAYLFLITCVPFSTIVMGRFAGFAPAVWLYVGHTLLIGLVGLRLVSLTPSLESGKHLRDRKAGSAILVLTSLLALCISLFSPYLAMWPMALNFATPGLTRWHERSRRSSRN